MVRLGIFGDECYSAGEIANSGVGKVDLATFAILGVKLG